MKTVGWAAVLGLAMAGCSTLGTSRADLVQDPQVCVATTLPIYFAEGEAGLTEPARELIRSTASALEGCDIQRVRVVGLASATGGSAANQTLSERRATTVAEALVAAGWPAPAFELAAAGDAGATDGGVAEPVRRRVDLVVEAAPPR